MILAQIGVQSLCNYWYPVYLSLGVSHWRFRHYLRALVAEGHTLGALLIDLRLKAGLP